MANLLPVAEKKRIQTIYAKRLFIVSLFSLLILITGGLVTLLPALFASIVKEKAAHDRLNIVAEIVSAEERKNLEKNAADINKKTKILSGESERFISLSYALKKIIERKNPHIFITSFFYDSAQEAEALRAVTISGTSVNRQTLVLFVNELRAEDIFSEVNVPVSNFVKNTDIPFSILLTLRDNAIIK